MYDNVSQKLKSFTKVLTIILLVLSPAGGITGGIFLLLAEAPIGYVIASVLGSAVLALLVYYGSCLFLAVAQMAGLNGRTRTEKHWTNCSANNNMCIFIRITEGKKWIAP